jgi:hypothetical protein
VPSTRERDDVAQLADADQWRRGLTLARPRPRAYQPRVLGENATLLGRVMPDTGDQGLPLISDTEDDFGVVRRLLTEHYAAFEGYVDGDEVDDTDPTQRDFLFGALLREIGVATRQDNLFSTLLLSVEVVSARVPWLGRFVIRPPLALYQRFLSAPAARIGDAYVALQTGFHHLVQYLCFVRGADESLLTARANEPRLVKASHDLLTRLDEEEPTAEERQLFRATPRYRTAWLVRFFHESTSPVARSARWARALLVVAIVASTGFLVVRSVRSAISYHPTYVARIQAQAARFAQGDKAR